MYRRQKGLIEDLREKLNRKREQSNTGVNGPPSDPPSILNDPLRCDSTDTQKGSKNDYSSSELRSRGFRRRGFPRHRTDLRPSNIKIKLSTETGERKCTIDQLKCLPNDIYRREQDSNHVRNEKSTIRGESNVHKIETRRSGGSSMQGGSSDYQRGIHTGDTSAKTAINFKNDALRREGVYYQITNHLGIKDRYSGLEGETGAFRGARISFQEGRERFRWERGDFRKGKDDSQGGSASFPSERSDFRGGRSYFRTGRRGFRGRRSYSGYPTDRGRNVRGNSDQQELYAKTNSKCRLESSESSHISTKPQKEKQFKEVSKEQLVKTSYNSNESIDINTKVKRNNGKRENQTPQVKETTRSKHINTKDQIGKEATEKVNQSDEDEWESENENGDNIKQQKARTSIRGNLTKPVKKASLNNTKDQKSTNNSATESQDAQSKKLDEKAKQPDKGKGERESEKAINVKCQGNEDRATTNQSMQAKEVKLETEQEGVRRNENLSIKSENVQGINFKVAEKLKQPDEHKGEHESTNSINVKQQ